MAIGRPTKFNKEIQNKIIMAIKAGNYVETAAAYAGINKSTLYDWLKRGEREKQRVAKNPRYKIRKSEAPFVGFSDAVEKALAEAEVRDVVIVGEAAKVHWQAAAWRLERRHPDRWGRRQVDMNVNQKMEGKLDVSVKENEVIKDEKTNELAHELLERLATANACRDGLEDK